MYYDSWKLLEYACWMRCIFAIILQKNDRRENAQIPWMLVVWGSFYRFFKI